MSSPFTNNSLKMVGFILIKNLQEFQKLIGLNSFGLHQRKKPKNKKI